MQLAGQILPFELLILAHVRRDHLRNLPRFQQLSEAKAIDAGVVGDDGKALHPGIAQRGNQFFGDAAQAETAGHDRHPVEQQAIKRGLRIGIELVGHGRPPFHVASAR